MSDYITDPAEWVRAHGSPRLRKALDLGMLTQSMGVYHDERIRHELVWFEPIGKREISDRLNPSEQELDHLTIMRTFYADAALVSIHNDGKWSPAITIPLPWEPKKLAVKILV